MSLPIDTSARISGPAARLKLVAAVRDALPSEPETDWIEWKGTAELTNKAWQGEIASHILGFANRDPQGAARNVAGHAYLLVGVEAGSLEGIDPLDPAKLDDGVARYLGGQDGPVWEPDYVDLDGHSVLVITVEPPRQGDPIYTLRKTFGDPAGNTQPDGRIFIRRMGKTAGQPTSAEFDMLQRRAKAATAAGGLDIALIAPDDLEISAVDLGEEACEDWLAGIRVSRLSELPKIPEAERPFAHLLRDPLSDPRTTEEFRDEVDRYLERLRPIFPLAARGRAVDAGLGRLSFQIANNSSENFHQILVELHIDGDILAAFNREEAEAEIEWPESPRKYGSSALRDFRVDIPAVKPISFNPGSIDNSASAKIRYPVFDLRPGYVHPLEEVHLLVADSLAGARLQATWHATSTSTSGSAGGEIIIPVSSTAVRL